MFKLLIITIICVTSCISTRGNKDRPKFIIDNDAGGDDAMAIYLALQYEKHFDGPELISLTTGSGNTDEDNVYINNQQILKVAGRQEVPIYRGSKTALIESPPNIWYYGIDGLGDSNEVYTDLVPAQNKSAIIALIELSKKYEGELTIITIGTLTNIAIALKIDPEFVNRLAHLYVGAGHVHSDEDPLPEFNARMDVEAYHIVMKHSNPDKVTVFPYSQTRASCDFSRNWRENVLGSIDTEIMREQNKHEKVSLTKNHRWQSLDPSVIAVFLNPDLVKEYKYARNDIVMTGDKRGMNTNTFVDDKENANVRMVYSVKTEDYRQFLMKVLSAGEK